MRTIAWGILSAWLVASCVSDVEQGPPIIQPSLRPSEQVKPKDQQDIQALVGQKLDDLQGCYDAEKAQKPGAKGRVLVSFIIDAHGQVGDPRVEYSSFQSPVFEGCLLGRVELWTFPKPPRGEPLKVRYPFGFGM